MHNNIYIIYHIFTTEQAREKKIKKIKNKFIVFVEINPHVSGPTQFIPVLRNSTV